MQDLRASANEKNIKPLDSSVNPPLGGRGAFLLHLADTNLILAQRNAEWCGHGPILEQDIAITNISLDQLGQARNFYQYAAELINQSTDQPALEAPASLHPAGAEITEDSLAYLRSEREYKNLLLAELPKGDWAQTILRQFFYSVYQYLLYEQLQKNPDKKLAGIAEKSIKEVTYHLKWSGEWVIRLGDGTNESRERMFQAMENCWPYTGEFFIPASYEKEEIIGFDLHTLKQAWMEKVTNVLEEATISPSWLRNGPGETIFMHTGGKEGIHTEYLGIILAEMQYLQRSYPGAKW